MHLSQGVFAIILVRCSRQWIENPKMKFNVNIKIYEKHCVKNNGYTSWFRVILRIMERKTPTYFLDLNSFPMIFNIKLGKFKLTGQNKAWLMPVGRKCAKIDAVKADLGRQNVEMLPKPTA